MGGVCKDVNTESRKCREFDVFQRSDSVSLYSKRVLWRIGLYAFKNKIEIEKTSNVLVIWEEVHIFAATVSTTLPAEQRTRVELLFYIHMEYTKQPIDFPGQVEMLKERGLIIEDEQYALECLRIISYFRLANYLRPMEYEKVVHRFKPDSRFENAISLYYFDKKLRTLVFTVIQSIEIALRTKIIHHFSLQFGAFWFMNKSLFKDDRIFGNCLHSIKEELCRSKEDFIVEHFARYDHPDCPPAWKTLEIVSFGTLSKLYGNLSGKAVKKQVAEEFMLPQHVYPESWIRSIAVLRNCCAHHARLWNRRFPMKPQLPKRLPEPWIARHDVQPDKIYVLLCCLAYLLDRIYPHNTFKMELKDLLKAYPNVDAIAMGFPPGWQSEAIWKD